MGRIYNNLERIWEKGKNEGNQEIYEPLIHKFVTLLTYEDVYLMNKMNSFFLLKRNGEDMFIDCGGFGVIITKEDKISIHT
jgi:hypothetical protein